MKEWLPNTFLKSVARGHGFMVKADNSQQEVVALKPDSQFVKYRRSMIAKSFVLTSKSRIRQI
jgi:hypothetical protein